jgi:NAD(P)H-quinone oxidoreductase subunit 5
VLAVTVAIGSLFGATLAAKPGAFTLGAVVVLAIILLLANGIDERPSVYVVARTVGLAAIVSLVYFGLQFLMEVLLVDSVPPTQALRGPLDLAIVVAIIVSFSVVTCFQSLLPGQGPEAKWAALYAHLSNGLYVNTIANRWLLRFWPSPPEQAGGAGGR